VNDLDRPECDNLRKGDSGWCTNALQLSLKQAGYKLAVDGEFGPGTDAALRYFQGVYGLEQDGIAGRQTREMLRVAIGKAEAAERVRNHDMGYWPDIVCAPLGVLSFTCEDLVDGGPAG
jgi:hypothetical protein